MPDVSSWLKVWTTGRQFSTLWETKPCCCSCNIWYSSVLLKHPKPFWKKSLHGSICCSKTCIYFSALMLPFWMFFSDRIASHRIVSYRIVSHRIVPYRTISYHIVSHRIIPYRIVSYRIASHRIVSSEIQNFELIAKNKLDASSPF